MAKKKIDIDKMELDKEDREYEEKLAEEEREKHRRLEEEKAAKEQERQRAEKNAEKERERQLADEKRELLKLRSGLADEEQSELTKKDAAYAKPTGKAAVANFWYHYKLVTIFSVMAVLIVSFLIYTEATRVRDDLCVMIVTDNDLTERTQELEEFFEQYVDDLDGNGYVHVGIITIPISQSLDLVSRSAYSQKFVAQVQTGEGMIVVTDSHTNEEYMELMNKELAADFPDNEYVNEQGFSFNSKIMAEELGYELMPNDVYMSIRTPVETMGMSAEEAEANYDESFVVFSRIVEDITARCRETNDPGLTTEPIEYDEATEPVTE